MGYLLFFFIMMQGTPNGWNPGMCKQPVIHATAGYINYCIANSKEYPSCPMSGNDPREAMWAQMAEPSKHGAYFEVLDCSWHAGLNPRDSTKQSSSPSIPVPTTTLMTPSLTSYTALTIQPDSHTLVKIHTAGDGDLLLEITQPNGKSLTVKRDGTVTGDLAKDEAAIAFWHALARAFPDTCSNGRNP